MAEVVITVEGPRRRVDVSVPQDRPVSEILPEIASICGESPSTPDAPGWQLIPLGSRPLAPGRTLAESGVQAGAVLQLRIPGSRRRSGSESGRQPRQPAASARPPREQAAPRPDGANEATAQPDPGVTAPGGTPPAAAPARAAHPAPPLPAPARTAHLAPPPAAETPETFSVVGTPVPSGPAAAPGPAPRPPPGGRQQATAHAPAQPTAEPPAAPAAPLRRPGAPSTTPVDRTRSVLPVRHSTIGRVGRSVLAALGRGRTDDAALTLHSGASDRPPTPQALTVQRRSSPLRRARQSWRESDYLDRLDSVIIRPRLHSCVTIAVMSPKGGVGKTTITALLGTLLALLRRDRIVAVDTNPDYGSLGRTLTPDHQIFVDDFLEVLEHPALTVTRLDTSMARGPHGLLVLPAPTAPQRMARLGEDAYRRVIDRLQDLVGVILLDCGTGLQEPTARAALAKADQIVLISDAEPATASLVAEASRLLLAAGAPLTLVVNKTTRKDRLDVHRFAAYVPEARALIRIPADERSAAAVAAGAFDWATAPEAWLVAVRELAVALLSDWQRLGLAG